MAYKQKIPEAWKRIKPNVGKFPHIYNLDAPVGHNGANRRLDVMLIQYLLQVWALNYEPGVSHLTRPKLKALRLDPLPMNGAYDNQTLAWIFYYQLANFHDKGLYTGKVTPAASDGSSLDGRHTLMLLNLQFAAPGNHDELSKEFNDLSSDPLAPSELILAVKDSR